MQAFNTVIKWSCYTGSLATLLALTIVFCTWASIEVLVMIIKTTS